jgi:hypothetical protein
MNDTMSRDRPLIWALLSDRVGDNAQVLALADTLGLPYETRHFSNKAFAISLNIVFGTRINAVRHWDKPDIPTWPDIVIAAGTQSEPICARIKAEAKAAGCDTKVVFLGRPWGNPKSYELIVATPQYRVPDGANVMKVELPLHQVSRAEALRCAEMWRGRLEHLPRPYVMVALGGNINRYTLDAQAVRRLATAANHMAAQLGGSVLVCSSYRTPAQSLETFQRYVTCPSYVHDWRSKASDNPYLAFLGLADRMIVTGDSMTMLAEAVEMQKPLFIFDMGEGLYGMHPQGHASPISALDMTSLVSAARATLKDLKVRFWASILPRRVIRDTSPIRNYLVRSGRASWLDDDTAPLFQVVEVPSIAPRVAARVRQLLPVERAKKAQPQTGLAQFTPASVRG